MRAAYPGFSLKRVKAKAISCCCEETKPADCSRVFFTFGWKKITLSVELFYGLKQCEPD